MRHDTQGVHRVTKKDARPLQERDLDHDEVNADKSEIDRTTNR
jgi:hypothetical protein